MLEFYDIEQVADLFRCDPKTVKKMIAQGEIRGARIGRGYVFSPADVMQAYEARAGARHDPTRPPALP